MLSPESAGQRGQTPPDLTLSEEDIEIIVSLPETLQDAIKRKSIPSPELARIKQARDNLAGIVEKLQDKIAVQVALPIPETSHSKESHNGLPEDGEAGH